MISLRFLSIPSLLLMGFTFSTLGQPLVAQSSSSSSSNSAQSFVREKTPSLIDPAGPTISLISSESVFAMSSALNVCGYDEGMDVASPIREHVRAEINASLAKSEEARDKRDKLCLYIAQHRLTGTQLDVAQYLSLALYLTPPPALETDAELTEMPPDSTQVVEVLPLLREFSAAVGLHGIWLTTHLQYDAVQDKIHDSLSKMIVNTNLYLKMPAETYSGRRFIVVIEPMLSPRAVNARVYGADYVVILSPINGEIRLNDVRHTYLHYLIEPLLYARANAIDRMQPILKEVREAPLEFRLRSDTVPLTIECLIKAIEARTTDTGIAEYKIPAGIDRSDLIKYDRIRSQTQQKIDTVRTDWVKHDVKQGYVLTQYFYDQMIQFEKDPASLKDTIGEMVYSMDVDQQAHIAHRIEFDKTSDGDILTRSKPHKLEGLDLAESRLAAGDTATAAAMAKEALTVRDSAHQSDTGKAYFILARTSLLAGHAEQARNEFQRALASSKDPRVISWSHIYLGRMQDLQCERDLAVEEYKQAMATRDGQLDTRLAAERGLKQAYALKGHGCDVDDDSDAKPEATPTQSPK